MNQTHIATIGTNEIYRFDEKDIRPFFPVNFIDLYRLKTVATGNYEADTELKYRIGSYLTFFCDPGMLIRESLFQHRTPVLFLGGTKSTGYKEVLALKARIEVRRTFTFARLGYGEYRAGEVRISARGTADFPSTKYGEYGVRIKPCWWGTN